MDAAAEVFGLTGKRILVTGASSGIGRAACHLLSRLGASLILVGRDPGTLRETLEGCAGEGHHVAPFDLAQAAALPEWMQELAAGGGPIHGLVHSAGIQVATPLRTLREVDLETVFRVNVQAGFLLAKAVRHRKVRAEEQSLVFLSSVAGQTASPGASVYAASKGAVDAMVRSLALELAPERVRVNGIAPGCVQTPMLGTLTGRMTEEQVQELVGMHPLGLGRPEDVANAIAFLLGRTAAWITGTILVVDGGYTAH
jgi:NAD(P)-dependent dehydrogenase (short-subunit alcohol dehydrogenase family)